MKKSGRWPILILLRANIRLVLTLKTGLLGLESSAMDDGFGKTSQSIPLVRARSSFTLCHDTDTALV